jgi:YtcA family
MRFNWPRRSLDRMSEKEKNRSATGRLFLLLPLWLLVGCSRAPSLDILGSFFPAWLLCLALGVLVAALVRWVLYWFHTNLALPVLAYPSLTAFLTFALWLIFFQ